MTRARVLAGLGLAASPTAQVHYPMTPILAGDRVWYSLDGSEACVAFVTSVHLDGTVARLWCVSRAAGGIVWADDPPEAQSMTPGAWWRA